MMQTLDGYDVVVAGGGPGGCGAAIAAARAGARTLLIEREGWLGGGATSMLVNPFMSDLTAPAPETGRQLTVNAGLYRQVVDRLLDGGHGQRWVSVSGGWGGVNFDDEALKIILDDLAAEAGVTVLFHTALFDVEKSGDRVLALRAAHNGGPLRIPGRVFVDSTGDGLLAAAAGASFARGDDMGETMPLTLCFAIGGLDLARVPSRHAIRARCATGAQDTPALLNTNFSFSQIPPHGLMYVNAIRIPADPMDAFSLSAAEGNGRKLIQNFMAWARAHLPGFEQAFVAKTGVHVGVRESRRIEGDYTLTHEDFKRCARFDDAIACCAYMLDTHGQRPGENRFEHLPPGEYYQIPYRCLIPRRLENVLIGSRCISASREAFSSFRVMPPVMNIGEGAGYAAALARATGEARAVDPAALQSLIRAQGGALEPRDAGLPPPPAA